MPDPRQKELDALLQRRDRLRDSVQRISGRLDAARQEVATVCGECEQRKVLPDKLDETIQKLSDRYVELSVELRGGIEAAEAEVAPYLMEDGA